MSRKKEGHNVLWTDPQLRESPAFRGLTASALLVLCDFHGMKQMKREGREYVCANNGDLVYTYAEAERRGISRATFQRAIDQLIERGFLDVHHTGAGLYRSMNQYALSGRWRFFGTPDFRPAARPPARTRRGFQPGHPPYSSAPRQPCTDGSL